MAIKLKKLLEEDINIPVNIGDTILVGKFRNKPIVIKTIEYDEQGLPIINGRKGVSFKIKERKLPINIFQ
jgi:hypothetical protein